mmetsp:Transcript_16101/g.27768  ORF Transcript_16101/g.27768 Transcript_16101/m.27768 type:complete len:326 (-) Transcript_16101:2023-3000(-)
MHLPATGLIGTWVGDWVPRVALALWRRSIVVRLHSPHRISIPSTLSTSRASRPSRNASASWRNSYIFAFSYLNMYAWSAYAHTPLRPYTSISCRPTRASFFVLLNRPSTPTSLPFLTNRSSMSWAPIPSVSPFTSTATGHTFGFSPTARHASSYRPFARRVSSLTRVLYPTNRAVSKLTLVRVANMPSRENRFASASSSSTLLSTPCSVASAAILTWTSLVWWRNQERTLRRCTRRSIMADSSGDLPHTPTVVQPLPRNVCSHWKQNIFAFAFCAATGTASSTSARPPLRIDTSFNQFSTSASFRYASTRNLSLPFSCVTYSLAM